MTLYFITSSKGKFLEVKSILPDVKQIDLDLQEIQDIDPKKVIGEKLKEAQTKQEGEFFCEDTSVYVNCLNGFPGPLIKWVLKSIGDKGLAELVLKYKDHSAIAKTVIGYTTGEETKFFEGSIKGTIVMPRGQNGFGWDKIFLPQGFDKTLGEMTLVEKNKISMRKIAVEKLKFHLKK